jgi:AraC-like DNA-binding protein
MATQTVLWVDLRTVPSGPDICGSLPPIYNTRRLRHPPDLLQAVESCRPWVVCLEYDVPDPLGLAGLTAVKTRHASLPIVVLAETHARRLEAMALRQGVWDYLVKPVSVRRLCRCLTSIGKAAPPVEQAPMRFDAMTSIEGLVGRRCTEGALGPAVSYVATNHPEKLRLATAAKLCDLSTFQFSRRFRKALGLTFRDFVVMVRIQRAAELIGQSDISVTEAAFVVGFNDLSYFSRMFRRQFGVTPSHYRRSQREPSQLSLFHFGMCETVVQETTGATATDS